jgi:Fe-S-cluster containining protein
MSTLEPNSVPCGTCRACCKKDVIVLGPNDDLNAFKWHSEFGRAVLDRKPNGECTYLGPQGCTVHGAAPEICRAFDCRVLFLKTPKDQRRIRITTNPSMRAVYDAGRSRLKTLEKA